jgi:DNA (cytosine-5)-methyltransferase 3A
MNVLSLFDGIACGRLACKRAGLPVQDYYASEINRYAMEIAYRNWPYITQVGDVRLLESTYFHNRATIDLLMAGSPCQGFSYAGNQLNFEDPRSELFFEFVRLKNELFPKWWLLENVVMKQEWQDIISEELGVWPILIDSAYYSAQRRKRLYWTNIPIGPYEIEETWKKLRLRDALLSCGPDWSKNKGLYEPLKLSEKELAYMDRTVADGRTHWVFHHHSHWMARKSACVVANWRKGVPYNVLIDADMIRKFHPIEAERLQTLPDNYTYGLSKTRRYEVIGNGWTVDVIAHILRGIT